MWARPDAAGNAIPESEAKSVPVMRWQVGGSLCFEGASVLVLDVFVDTANYVAAVAAGNRGSSLVEDDDDWNF